MDSVGDDCPSPEPHEADTDELLDGLCFGPVRVVICNESVGSTTAGDHVTFLVQLHGGSWRHVRRYEWFLHQRAKAIGGVRVVCVIHPSGSAVSQVRLYFFGIANFLRAREILDSLLEG